MSRHREDGVVGVVLAGGEGKRLRPLTYYFQKCMIPIGSRQKPLLEYILLTLRKHGIDEIKLLVGYKHEQIVNYFNNGGRFRVRLDYFIDDPSLGGSGGALLSAYKNLAFDDVDTMLVYYGDILSSINLSEMVRQHRSSGAAATLAVTKGFEVPVGVAKIEGKLVKEWVEKPTIDLCAGIGIVILSRDVFGFLEELAQAADKIDLMGDLIPHLIGKGMRVEAYLTDQFWYDVGSTEKYEKLDNELVDKLFSS